MDSNLKTRWVEALRSGEYPQTKGRLHTPQGYCCLGVLCDILKEEKNLEWTLKNDFWEPRYLIASKGHTNPEADAYYGSTMLPTLLAEEIDLPWKDQAPLQRMNDLDGRDFNEIADWIEANV